MYQQWKGVPIRTCFERGGEHVKLMVSLTWHINTPLFFDSYQMWRSLAT